MGRGTQTKKSTQSRAKKQNPKGFVEKKQVKKVECYNCDTTINAYGPKTESYFLYDSPWSDGETRYFCDEECLHSTLEASEFGYFYCECCDKMICAQNIDNGHESYIRRDEDDCVLCVECKIQQLLDEGYSFEEVDDTISGEFINVAELEEKGFKQIESSTRIQSNQDAFDFNTKCKEYYDKRNVIFVRLTSLGIPGIEGYVELWIKDKKNEISK